MSSTQKNFTQHKKTSTPLYQSSTTITKPSLDVLYLDQNKLRQNLIENIKENLLKKEEASLRKQKHEQKRRKFFRDMNSNQLDIITNKYEENLINNFFHNKSLCELEEENFANQVNLYNKLIIKNKNNVDKKVVSLVSNSSSTSNENIINNNYINHNLFNEINYNIKNNINNMLEKKEIVKFSNNLTNYTEETNEVQLFLSNILNLVEFVIDYRDLTGYNTQNKNLNTEENVSSNNNNEELSNNDDISTSNNENTTSSTTPFLGELLPSLLWNDIRKAVTSGKEFPSLPSLLPSYPTLITLPRLPFSLDNLPSSSWISSNLFSSSTFFPSQEIENENYNLISEREYDQYIEDINKLTYEAATSTLNNSNLEEENEKHLNLIKKINFTSQVEPLWLYKNDTYSLLGNIIISTKSLLNPLPSFTSPILNTEKKFLLRGLISSYNEEIENNFIKFFNNKISSNINSSLYSSVRLINYNLLIEDCLLMAKYVEKFNLPFSPLYSSSSEISSLPIPRYPDEYDEFGKKIVLTEEEKERLKEEKLTYPFLKDPKFHNKELIQYRNFPSLALSINKFLLEGKDIDIRLSILLLSYTIYTLPSNISSYFIVKFPFKYEFFLLFNKEVENWNLNDIEINKNFSSYACDFAPFKITSSNPSSSGTSSESSEFSSEGSEITSLEIKAKRNRKRINKREIPWSGEDEDYTSLPCPWDVFLLLDTPSTSSSSASSASSDSFNLYKSLDMTYREQDKDLINLKAKERIDLITQKKFYLDEKILTDEYNLPKETIFSIKKQEKFENSLSTYSLSLAIKEDEGNKLFNMAYQLGILEVLKYNSSYASPCYCVPIISSNHSSVLTTCDSRYCQGGLCVNYLNTIFDEKLNELFVRYDLASFVPKVEEEEKKENGEEIKENEEEKIEEVIKEEDGNETEGEKKEEITSSNPAEEEKPPEFIPLVPPPDSTYQPLSIVNETELPPSFLTLLNNYYEILSNYNSKNIKKFFYNLTNVRSIMIQKQFLSTSYLTSLFFTRLNNEEINKKLCQIKEFFYIINHGNNQNDENMELKFFNNIDKKLYTNNNLLKYNPDIIMLLSLNIQELRLELIRQEEKLKKDSDEVLNSLKNDGLVNLLYYSIDIIGIMLLQEEYDIYYSTINILLDYFKMIQGNYYGKEINEQKNIDGEENLSSEFTSNPKINIYNELDSYASSTPVNLDAIFTGATGKGKGGGGDKKAAKGEPVNTLQRDITPTNLIKSDYLLSLMPIKPSDENEKDKKKDKKKDANQNDFYSLESLNNSESSLFYSYYKLFLNEIEKYDQDHFVLPSDFFIPYKSNSASAATLTPLINKLQSTIWYETKKFQLKIEYIHKIILNNKNFIKKSNDQIDLFLTNKLMRRYKKEKISTENLINFLEYHLSQAIPLPSVYYPTPDSSPFVPGSPHSSVTANVPVSPIYSSSPSSPVLSTSASTTVNRRKTVAKTTKINIKKEVDEKLCQQFDAKINKIITNLETYIPQDILNYINEEDNKNENDEYPSEKLSKSQKLSSLIDTILSRRVEFLHYLEESHNICSSISPFLAYNLLYKQENYEIKNFIEEIKKN